MTKFEELCICKEAKVGEALQIVIQSSDYDLFNLAIMIVI